jgi:hypothetical protein
MKKEIIQKLKIYTTLSVLTIVLGVILLIYMIRVEDEPGALPLLLIMIGTVWFIINRVKTKKQLQ